MRDFDPTASEFISTGYIDKSRPGGVLYDFMSIASVAAPIIGGMMGDDAARDAAGAQIAASDRASATQEAARVQQRADLMPWMQGGQMANNALLSRLGLGPRNGSGVPAAPTKTADQFRQELLGQFTTQGPQEIYRFDQGDQTGYGFNAPSNIVDEAGLNAAVQRAIDAQQSAYIPPTQTADDPNYGSLLKKFNQNDLNSDLVYQNGLQFGLNTGVNQLNQRAAAGGNYGSGAALKALTRFGNDYATTKTEGAYNRNQGEKAQTYNFLSGVSGQGQSAAAGVGAAGLATGNNIANNQLAAGNASAAGIVGGANAMSNGIANATNAFQWNQMMTKKNPWATPGINGDIPMQPGGGY
jgi:hypothetical protein